MDLERCGRLCGPGEVWEAVWTWGGVGGCKWTWGGGEAVGSWGGCGWTWGGEGL